MKCHLQLLPLQLCTSRQTQYAQVLQYNCNTTQTHNSGKSVTQLREALEAMLISQENKPMSSTSSNHLAGVAVTQ